jgi:hypothetical protein
MGRILDEKGRLFGTINVVDVLVVLVVLAVVAAGVALVFGGDSSDSRTTTMDVRAENVQPYVANAIPIGDVSEGNVERVLNASATPKQILAITADGELVIRDHPRLKTVETTVEVPVSDDGNGVQFQGQRLKIGQRVTLDFGLVELTGNVTAVGTSGSAQ